MFRKLIKSLLMTLGGAALLLVLAVIVVFFAVFPIRQPLSYGAPLDVDGPESTAILTVRVSKPDTYAVSLSYPYLDSNVSNASGVERQTAWKFAGGHISSNGASQETGSPFDFQVHINEMPSEKEILNQHVSHPKLTSWSGNTLNAELVRIKLGSGEYQVFVRRSGELGDIPRAVLQLQFGRAYQGK